MSAPEILVIGATGVNGRALLAELGQRGVPARAMVRGADHPALAGAVEIVHGNLVDPASLRRAMAGIGKLYVVTSIQPDTVALFENAYAAAKDAGVRHVVKFSGLGSDIGSPSEVIRQHGVSDAALVVSGLPYTILRPNSFHQNMLWQAKSIAETGAFYLPLGEARQSTVDVRDLAEATARILSESGHKGRTYDLTGPESLSFADVAAIIGSMTGRDVRYVPVTRDEAEQAMLSGGMPPWNAHVLAEVQALFATGAYADTTADLAMLLGREPRTFRHFVEDHCDAFVTREAIA